MTNVVEWLGYEFTVYAGNANWNEVGGLYVFVRHLVDDQGTPQWYALYVGQTRNFADRIPTHEKWLEAVRMGANQIHARTEENGLKREALEKKLIESYEPTLNLEHRQT